MRPSPLPESGRFPRSAPDSTYCGRAASAGAWQRCRLRRGRPGVRRFPPTGARACGCRACSVRLAGRHGSSEPGAGSPPGFGGSHGPGAVRSEPVGVADPPAEEGAGRVSPIRSAQPLSGSLQPPGLRCSTPRWLVERRALLSDAVILGQRDC